jgi:hypothetical protein
MEPSRARPATRGGGQAKLRVAGRARIVIVGAGFGELAAARALARAPAELVVIDQRNHLLFQPLLYQDATDGLSVAAGHGRTDHGDAPGAMRLRGVVYAGATEDAGMAGLATSSERRAGTARDAPLGRPGAQRRMAEAMVEPGRLAMAWPQAADG